MRDDAVLGNFSHRGVVRAENEDFFGYAEPADEESFRRRGRVVVVADGVGGHVGGKRASRLAVDAFLAAYAKSSPAEKERALRQALEAANAAIREEAAREPDLAGMATTLLAFAQIGARGYAVHVGDGRLYLIREGAIDCLTTDHTLARAAAEDPARFAWLRSPNGGSTFLTRALGLSDRVEPDAFSFELSAGDHVLLCTDGLYKHFSSAEIGAGVLRAPDPQAACERLVEEANQRGGDDNATIQILRIDRIPGA